MSKWDDANKIRNEADAFVEVLVRNLSKERGQIFRLAESRCEGKPSVERDAIMQQAQRECDTLAAKVNEKARRIREEAAFRASQILR